MYIICMWDPITPNEIMIKLFGSVIIQLSWDDTRCILGVGLESIILCNVLERMLKRGKCTVFL